MAVAPRAGFEPATNRLTAGCSATELPGNKPMLRQGAYNKACLLWQSTQGGDTNRRSRAFGSKLCFLAKRDRTSFLHLQLRCGPGFVPR